MKRGIFINDIANQSDWFATTFGYLSFSPFWIPEGPASSLSLLVGEGCRAKGCVL